MQQPPRYIVQTYNLNGLPPSIGPRAVSVRMQFATEEKHRYLSQILATLAISLGPFAAGLGKGYSSPAIASLQDQFGSVLSTPSFSSSPSPQTYNNQKNRKYKNDDNIDNSQYEHQQQRHRHYHHNNHDNHYDDHRSRSSSSNGSRMSSRSNTNVSIVNTIYVAATTTTTTTTSALNTNENGNGNTAAAADAATVPAFSVTTQQTSWVASLSLLGALFGAIFGGLAMKFGRRNVLRATAVPFSVSWIMTVFAVNVQMIYLTSFIAGFCCAIILMVSQVYISEISDPSIRGCLSAVLKIFGQVGVLISFIMGAYLDWRQLAMAISVAPIALFFTTLYLPETPSYLVLSGRIEEAARSLQWLKGGTHYEIHEELAIIKNNVLRCRFGHGDSSTTAEGGIVAGRRQVQCDGGHYGSFSDMFDKLWHPILITCGLMFFQRFSGANAFNSYAVLIFRQTFGGGGMNPHGGAVAVSFVQLLASLLSGLLIDSVGRLPLLITSSIFMSIALAAFGSFAYFQEVNQSNMATATAAVKSTLHAMRTTNVQQQHHQYHNLLASMWTSTSSSPSFIRQEYGGSGVSEYEYDWIPLLCVLIFTIAFSLGISPISWLLVGELFALEYRGLGSALALSFSYGCAFVGVKTFVDFHETLGLYGAFWLYSAVAVSGLCFVVCFVPETKGRELQEMNHEPRQP